MYKITYTDKQGAVHAALIAADTDVQAVMRFDFDYEGKYSWIKNVKEL